MGHIQWENTQLRHGSRKLASQLARQHGDSDIKTPLFYPSDFSYSFHVFFKVAYASAVFSTSLPAATPLAQLCNHPSEPHLRAHNLLVPLRRSGVHCTGRMRTAIRYS